MDLNIVSQIAGTVGGIAGLLSLLIMWKDIKERIIDRKLEKRMKKMFKKNKCIVLNCRVIGGYLNNKYRKKYTINRIEKCGISLYESNKIKEMYMSTEISQDDELDSTVRFWVGEINAIACCEISKEKHNRCIPTSKLTY